MAYLWRLNWRQHESKPLTLKPCFHNLTGIWTGLYAVRANRRPGVRLCAVPSNGVTTCSPSLNGFLWFVYLSFQTAGRLSTRRQFARAQEKIHYRDAERSSICLFNWQINHLLLLRKWRMKPVFASWK